MKICAANNRSNDEKMDIDEANFGRGENGSNA